MELSTKEKELALHVFKNWNPEINGIQANTFRVRNHEHIDLIDKLTGNVIEKNSNGYFLPFASLLLLQDKEVNRFVKSLEPLYSLLRNNFINSPEGATKFSELQEMYGLDDYSYKKAIRYLYDSSVITCYPNNLYEDGVTTHYSERILKHKTFHDYLKWWENVRFGSEKTTIKKPGNKEVNASKREEILGAAIAILSKYPKECIHGDKIVGVRIYRLIDEYAFKFWPDTGEPPLGEESSTELINKWLKTLQ